MTSVLLSIGAALAISLTFLLNKLAKGEKFDAFKLGRTLLIGVVIGFSCAVQTACEVTTANWDSLLVGNGMIIVLIDQLIIFIQKMLNKDKEPVPEE